ncbi:hypothetical protein PAMP_000103 [Pampus punctatissimus]
MKTLVALILLALICFPYLCSAGPNNLDSVCCQTYNRTHIPSIRIKHAMVTSSGCSTSKAIVVTVTSDKKFCIDPKLKWAVRLLKKYQAK